MAYDKNIARPRMSELTWAEIRNEYFKTFLKRRDELTHLFFLPNIFPSAIPHHQMRLFRYSSLRSISSHISEPSSE